MLKRNDEMAVSGDVPGAGKGGSPSRLKPVLRGSAQVLVVFAILLGGAMGMQRIVATKPERPSRPAIATILPVTAERVVAGDHQPAIRLFGEIVAAQSIDMRPPAAGEIVAVKPGLAGGARVEAGDVLVTLDDFDARGAVVEARANLAQTDAAIAEIRARISSEQAQLEATEDQVRLAREDLERAGQLRRTGAVTQKALDDRALIVSQREAAADQRRANLSIEQARLAQQEAQRERLAWKLEQAERALSDISMIAPFAGIVRATSAETGKRVNQSDVLVSLYGDRTLEARFTLSNAQFGRLAGQESLVGRPVTGVWDVGGTRVPFAGSVSRIGAEVASARGGVEVFAAIEQAAGAGAELRPGAFVAIELPDRTYPGSVRLPETALYPGERVYVVEDDGALTPRDVTVAAYDGPSAIVTAGVEPGEVVLATRLTDIDSGTRVGVVSGTAEGFGAAFQERGQGRPGAGNAASGS